MEKLKILIPTDFSVQAEYAYLMVKKLEEKVPIEAHLLHIMDVPGSVTLNAAGDFETCDEIDINYLKSQKEIVVRKLQSLKSTYGESIQTNLVTGKLTDEILRYSQENKFDLIVMGTKGAWGLKEKLSGSETQFIARKSEIPLLSLMCDRSDLTIKNILLVHDFSKTSDDELNLLKKLVLSFQAKTHLLQILKRSDNQNTAFYLAQMDAYAKLNGIINYEKHLLQDTDVESGVIHFNQMHDVDIVCIGTHGKGGLFHSSATEKLINHLFKPIISFRLKN